MERIRTCDSCGSKLLILEELGERVQRKRLHAEERQHLEVMHLDEDEKAVYDKSPASLS